MALKYAKRQSRLKSMVYDSSLDEKEDIKRNIEKTKILYHALSDKRIKAYFQPIVENKNKKILKYEVLARVIHKDNRVESIYPYLEIAKENKLYSNITQAILEESYYAFKDNDLHFSINLSTEDITDTNVLDNINRFFLQDKSIAQRVTFEMLESESVQDYNEIKEFIAMVKSKSAKVAIDDFGSGYSNFSHLLNLDVDFIKIDGSLIKNIDKDENAKKIVTLIQQFAKDSNMEVVAEFVENEKIYNVLNELNVEYSQGYYFSKPLEFIRDSNYF